MLDGNEGLGNNGKKDSAKHPAGQCAICVFGGGVSLHWRVLKTCYFLIFSRSPIYCGFGLLVWEKQINPQWRGAIYKPVHGRDGNWPREEGPLLNEYRQCCDWGSTVPLGFPLAPLE